MVISRVVLQRWATLIGDVNDPVEVAVSGRLHLDRVGELHEAVVDDRLKQLIAGPAVAVGHRHQ